MTGPAISVIMATYNGSAFINETIASLLEQSCRDFELVVVDDCSTDNTLARLQSYNDPRIRIFHSANNAGPVAARNLAVGLARGRYIAALDQDDVSHPERLARQLGYLEANPNIVLLGTAACRLTNGRITPDGFPAHTTPGLLRWMLHVRNPFVWSSVMMRADTVRALGIFSRVEREFAEDFDLYHRLARHGDLARLGEVLTTYRCHSRGASHTKQKIMIAKAADTLGDAYDALGRQDTRAMALQIARHVAGRIPVSDWTTLERLRQHLAIIAEQFLARYDTDVLSGQMIKTELARVQRQLALSFVRHRINHVVVTSLPSRAGAPFKLLNRVRLRPRA